jgi:hypothetical protein
VIAAASAYFRLLIMRSLRAARHDRIARRREMETLYERAAGLDVHKDTVVACVRTIEGREVNEELAEFGTTTEELLALRDWLALHRVEVIGMESTGVYWKPVFYLLEERVEPGEVDGVDVKQVAGHDPVGLGAEEVAPGGPQPPCRRVDASSLDNSPDGPLRDPESPPSSTSVAELVRWARAAVALHRRRPLRRPALRLRLCRARRRRHDRRVR